MAKVYYPLYETTVFRDFRVMTENVARKYPDRIAISYKKDPHDSETVKVTYAEARDYIRNIGTELIAMGCRDRHVALIGESSYEWICSYFSLMSISSVVVPLDKDYPVEDLSDIMNKAECEFVIYSPSIEEKIEQVREKVPGLKTFICMRNATMPDAVKLSDIEARSAERYKNGDNSYYDYEIDIYRKHP